MAKSAIDVSRTIRTSPLNRGNNDEKSGISSSKHNKSSKCRNGMSFFFSLKFHVTLLLFFFISNEALSFKAVLNKQSRQSQRKGGNAICFKKLLRQY